jgi:hypothetical protein
MPEYSVDIKTIVTESAEQVPIEAANEAEAKGTALRWLNEGRLATTEGYKVITTCKEVTDE